MNTESTCCICHACVGEPHLSNDIRKEGQAKLCAYCDRKLESIDLEAFADRIELAFKQHYERTADEPDIYQSTALRDGESCYNWERSGDTVIDAIECAAKVCTQAAIDVQKLLENRHVDFNNTDSFETEFSFDSYYERRMVDDIKWRNQWQSLENAIRNENRYFNTQVFETLTNLFSGIESFAIDSGDSVLVAVGPQSENTSVYRARAFHQDSEIEEALTNPEKELGPPPSSVSKSGRMNATGISVFYGSDDPVTAIAEVRPSVGSTVLTTRFTFNRMLTLLDLDALAMSYERGSIFDPNFSDRLERNAFLSGLERRLIIPVAPDRESLDYVVTQTIADFLAAHEANIDGIRFRSTQVAKKSVNIVLFHKSSRVAPAPIGRQRTVVKLADDYENLDSECKFYVHTKSSGVEIINKSLMDSFFAPQPEDLREYSLSIDLNSIVIHHIDGVQFDSSSYQFEKSPFSTDDSDF